MKTKFELPLLGFLIALVSGSVDAYTFIHLDGVFAGLQTGNMILLGINISQFHWLKVAHLLFSVFMFGMGVLIIKIFQMHHHDENQRKRIILCYELCLLVLAVLLSDILPQVLIVGILALVTAAQLQEFNRLRGNDFNPVMMTGNVKKIVNNTYASFHGNHAANLVIKDTFLTIGGFVGGAFLMGLLSHYFGSLAILGLAIPLFIMFQFTKP